MLCSVCQRELSCEQIHRSQFYVCRSCRGVWVHIGQLAELAKSIGSNGLSSTQIAAKARSVALAGKAIECCQCGQAMDRFEYAYDSGIMIDRCGGCGSIWLDKEKLLRIKEHLEQSEPIPGEAAGLLGRCGKSGFLASLSGGDLDAGKTVAAWGLEGVAEVLLSFLFD